MQYGELAAVLHLYLTALCQLEALFCSAVCFDLRHFGILLEIVVLKVRLLRLNFIS